MVNMEAPEIVSALLREVALGPGATVAPSVAL
jgi:hypothetical protein